MNNLYNWHDEWMNELKQREISKELEQIRLIKEAVGHGTSWLAQLANSVGNALASWKERRQEARSNQRYAHHSAH